MLSYLDNPSGKSDTEDVNKASELGQVDDGQQVPIVAPDFTEGDAQSVETLYSGSEADNQANLYKEKIKSLERRIGYLERIVKISQILNSTLTLEPLLQIIVQAATELTNTHSCSILLIDKNTNELRFAEVSGGLTNDLRKISVPLANSIAGWVVSQKRPLLIRDASDDPRWHRGVDDSTEFKTESILGVPLKFRDEIIGVLEVVNKQSEAGFDQDDIQIATTLGAQAAIAIENTRLLDELQQAYQGLAEVDQLKGDFVSIASHELRTPLSVILGYASFLRDNVSGQASEQLDIVLSSAMRLRSLIDDMINLRHIQADEVQLERTIFSLRRLVIDVTTEFGDLIKGKQLTLTTRFSPNDDPLNLDADRQKIYLVLANLLSNAVKFTDGGGRLHLNVELKGYEYWINVIDTGIGIPKTEYNRIFDQFYQSEPSLTRKYQGMGVGLSITKGMVEIHHGRVWVESIVGKGSNFTVVLPTAPDVVV